MVAVAQKRIFCTVLSEKKFVFLVGGWLGGLRRSRRFE